MSLVFSGKLRAGLPDGWSEPVTRFSPASSLIVGKELANSEGVLRGGIAMLSLAFFAGKAAASAVFEAQDEHRPARLLVSIEVTRDRGVSERDSK
jgi:hypothetical protein